MTIAPQNAPGANELALSARDIDLIETLARKVRVLTLHQVARTWWAGTSTPNRIAWRRLLALEGAGYVQTFIAFAHPEILLRAPVLSWTPDSSVPNFGAVSYQLKSRWSQPPQNIHCVIASTMAGRNFGGHGGRRPRESEETHDIHFAQVFLLYRQRSPNAAHYWIPEETIRETRTARAEKLPDAIIDEPGRRRVVEFGGAYPKPKLIRFHEYCAEELAIPYEVW